MEISVKNAFANNLKNIDVRIPVGKITALTGVSGSGKSSLLKDVLYAYGARNFTRTSNKTIKKSLSINRTPKVERITNMQVPMLIDVKNSIPNSNSTVATVSGITELLRNAFLDSGKMICCKCNSCIIRDYASIRNCSVDLEINEKFDEALESIRKRGNIDELFFFDEDYKPTSIKSKQRYSTVVFRLDRIRDQFIYDFNKSFDCRITAVSANTGIKYDLKTEIECNKCYSINPNLLRSRFSFSTEYCNGGGACRCCFGKGKTYRFERDKFFSDDSLSLLAGASKYVTEKGIKYTTVTEKFLQALFKVNNVGIDTPIKEIPNDFLEVLLFGSDQEIAFQDRIGGRKHLCYQGIANYLQDCFVSGKHADSIAELFVEQECDSCHGTRFDVAINSLRLCDTTFNAFMHMSLDDLNSWCSQNIDKVSCKTKGYLTGIMNSTNNYHLLSCGHLVLSRASNSLSGGELQRIRIGTLLSSKVRCVCYLLDEPSSGLHCFDINNLMTLLHTVCNAGNTVILVEHNKMVISQCDHVVDLGPSGGIAGGQILFSLPLDRIKEGNTLTSKMLLKNKEIPIKKGREDERCYEYIELNNLTKNNLKNITIQIPRNAYSVICGVSGSGKTTLARDVLYPSVQNDVNKLGFDDVDYLGQSDKYTSLYSTVSSVLDIGKLVSGIYAKASDNKFDKSCFLISSQKGKCVCCKGKGVTFTDEGEPIGVCEECDGIGFAKSVASVKVNDLNIFEFYNMSISELRRHVTNTKLLEIIELANKVGVDYLSFSRTTKSLSKGELQRVYLIKTLLLNSNNRMIILDEPSRGLHASDKAKLVEVLSELTQKGNTIVSVEHDPEMIRKSDYIIELGGTGTEGGFLLFQGRPMDVCDLDTPISKVIRGVEVSCPAILQSKSDAIQIKDNTYNLKYEPHAIYHCSGIEQLLTETAEQTMKAFLSVAIPGNTMFSKNANSDVGAEIPLVSIVDFDARINVDATVGEILDLRRLICDEVLKTNSNRIAQYIFDQESLTGKCSCCKGEGVVWSVDEEYFVQDKRLSASCRKFLKNRADYKQISQVLRTRRIKLDQEIPSLSLEEKTALFWGDDHLYAFDDDLFHWQGIIPLFMMNHSHYPDSGSEKIYKNKTQAVCPLCRGQRLKKAYIDYSFNGLSYSEIMSLPTKELLSKLSDNKSKNGKELLYRLKLMNKVGLGNISIGIKLSELDSKDAARVKLVSLLVDKILDLGILVKSINKLSKDEKSIIFELLDTMIETNTIWVVE